MGLTSRVVTKSRANPEIRFLIGFSLPRRLMMLFLLCSLRISELEGHTWLGGCLILSENPSSSFLNTCSAHRLPVDVIESINELLVPAKFEFSRLLLTAFPYLSLVPFKSFQCISLMVFLPIHFCPFLLALNYPIYGPRIVF